MPSATFTRILPVLAAIACLATSGIVAIAQQAAATHSGLVELVVWIGATLICALVFAAAAWRIARHWTHDLEAIGESVLAAGADEEAPLLTISRCSELAELAHKVQRMQARVAVRIERLRESGERLETVLSSMIEGVLVIDAQERVLLANHASRRLLNVPDCDVVGRPLLEVLRSRHVHDAWLAGMRSAVPYSAQFESRPPRRFLSIGAARLPGDPPSGIVLVLHDLTEVRRLESLRRDFVANVSHELKTPLAAIQLYAETLRMGAVNDPRHNLQFLARIEEQTERLHELIRDMLQIARIESGRELFRIADVPLAATLHEVIDEFTFAAESKQVSLTAEPLDPILHVRADPEGLRTILRNLVDNALKFTPSGGNVSVRAWRHEKVAVLEVKDSGIGISPDDQPRVFERFFRADKSRSHDVRGTGLGLSIVKHLTLAFGGDVEVESQLGAGSVFRVRLPQRTEKTA